MTKSPLQALLVAPDYLMRKNILSGKKKISIREGHRDYQVGKPVMLCCHIVPWVVMADVISVRHCTLGEVTEEEYRDDGFETQEELLVGLQQFYPDMTPDSPVTVICWENVRGFLAENAKDYACRPRKLFEKIKHKN